jgi:hypothetical protein
MDAHRELIASTYERFALSDFGQFQAEQRLRFSKEYSCGSRDEMLSALGDDVHPVRHMLHTHNKIVDPLLEHGTAFDLDPADAKSLRITALIHDIGECEHPAIKQAVGVIVGDVPYFDKKEEDELNEVLIRTWLYDSLFTDLPAKVVERVESILTQPKTNELGVIFNMCERLGYYETAIRAGRIVLGSIGQSPKPSTATLPAYAALARIVSISHQPILQTQAHNITYIEKRLEETADVFERIQRDLP